MTLDDQLRAALDADDLAAIDRIQRLIDGEDEANRARLASVDALSAAALYYAHRGWAVFPCGPMQKRPGIPSPHPLGSEERKNCKGECGQDGHGLHDATTDVDKIRGWWIDNPAYNVALRTGITFDVIDIDGYTGMESLLQWRRDVAESDEDLTDHLPPKLGSVLTPRRPGQHRYISPTGQGNATGMLPGIDFRGVGGYVLAPPSRTEHGMYLWAAPVAT